MSRVEQLREEIEKAEVVLAESVRIMKELGKL